MKKIICAVALWFTFSGARAQSFNPQLANMLQDTLDYYVSAIANIEGMSAAVYCPGQGVWTGASGLSYTGQPLDYNMEFGIASNTKLFVSAIMLMLSENNLISLDDSLHEWLPAYANIDPDITIRQLLNHTSGISDPIFLSPWMDTIMQNPTRVFTPDEVLSWVGSPFFSPGISWGYSNINYILAGMIAESATGYHISNLIRDSLLTPLGLDSIFYDVEEPEIGELAHRWFNGIDFQDTSRVGLNTAGGCAGALFSTSGQMVAWYHAMMSGQVLSAASFSELTHFVETGIANYDYGLGIARETTIGKTYWGHGGSTWGYKSKMIYDTCMQVSVCGLANSFPAGMDGVTFLLYKVLYDHLPSCGSAISGSTTVCQGDEGLTYTVAPIANATSYEWTLPPGISGSNATNSIIVNMDLTAVSGDITVSGVNDYGNGAASLISVIVNPKPPTPVIIQNGNQLQSDAPTGNQWYDSNGLIPGATDSTFILTGDGEYYVIVTLSGCSSDTSNILQAVFDGTDEVSRVITTALYPNPFTSELNIELRSNTTTAEFVISNSFGVIVCTGMLQEKDFIQTVILPPGIYFFKFSVNGKTEIRKIVKQ